MQSVSSRIWTRVAVFNFLKSCVIENILLLFLPVVGIEPAGDRKFSLYLPAASFANRIAQNSVFMQRNASLSTDYSFSEIGCLIQSAILFLSSLRTDGFMSFSKSSGLKGKANNLVQIRNSDCSVHCRAFISRASTRLHWNCVNIKFFYKMWKRCQVSYRRTELFISGDLKIIKLIFSVMIFPSDSYRFLGTSSDLHFVCMMRTPQCK